MKEFENRYIKVRFDIPYIEEIADEYDFFVVGSDQVWQPIWIQPKYFLDFVPREKKSPMLQVFQFQLFPKKSKNFSSKAFQVLIIFPYVKKMQLK